MKLTQQLLAVNEVQHYGKMQRSMDDIPMGGTVIYSSIHDKCYKMSTVRKKNDRNATLGLQNGDTIQLGAVVDTTQAAWNEWKDKKVVKEAAGEVQWEMMMKNGKIKRFMAVDKEAAVKTAKGAGAKSLIRLSQNFRPIGKPISLTEATDRGLWKKLNDLAKKNHGEFGFATLDEKDMAKYIDLKKANKLAMDLHGEFGFATLGEPDMKVLIQDNPSLVKSITESEETICSEAVEVINRLLAEGKIGSFEAPFKSDGRNVRDASGRAVDGPGVGREALKDIAKALNAFVTTKESITEGSKLNDVSIDDMKDARTADKLEVGDVVHISGNVQYKDQVGEIESFGKDKKFVVVKLYGGKGVHSFHSSDVSEEDTDHEDDDEDEEIQKFYVAFYETAEERPWIGMVSREGGGKWHEKHFKGEADHRWGQTYMSYLEPADIMSWIFKDYGRHIEIDGPFLTSVEAEDHVRENWGTIKESVNESPEGQAKNAVRLKAAEKADFNRMMAGAMSRDEFNKKWKKGKYAEKSGKYKLDPTGVYHNLIKTVDEAVTYTDFDDWKDAVKNSYPAQAKKMRFNGRMEGGKMTVSAEVPGVDRCFGVWDQDKDKGTVLSETKSANDRLADRARELLPRLKGPFTPKKSVVSQCAELAAKYFNSAGLQSSMDIDEFIKTEMAKRGITEGVSEAITEGKAENIAKLRKEYDNAMHWVGAARSDRERRQHQMTAMKIANHLKKQYQVDVNESITEAEDTVAALTSKLNKVLKGLGYKPHSKESTPGQSKSWWIHADKKQPLSAVDFAKALHEVDPTVKAVENWQFRGKEQIEKSKEVSGNLMNASFQDNDRPGQIFVAIFKKKKPGTQSKRDYDNGLDPDARFESVKEAFKLKDKVKIVKGPKDCTGKEGFVGEIRTDVGGKKTFTIDYDLDEKTGFSKSVQLKADDIRSLKESTEQLEVINKAHADNGLPKKVFFTGTYEQCIDFMRKHKSLKLDLMYKENGRLASYKL